MSVSLEMRSHPRVQKALDEASDLIWSWVKSQPAEVFPEGITAEGLKSYLAWWPGVVLQERIALALLDASGWDYEFAEALMDRRPRGAPMSDVLAEIDRVLALPEPERVDLAHNAAIGCGRPACSWCNPRREVS